MNSAISPRRALVSGATASALLLALAVAPIFVGASIVDKLNTLFILMLLAAMWGLMAGQAGLVSVGQQAFFGLGGYFALRLVDAGISVYPALLLGAVIAAVAAWLMSFFLLRLKDGEFAIATWVAAEVIRILVMLDPLVQGETGTSLLALNSIDPELRRNVSYGFALGALVLMLLVVRYLMRSPVGTASRALGDDEEAAASLGVRVMATRRVVYVLAAFGCALAGVAWLASAITFLPRTNFGVQWSALMLFMVLVGGLRSLVGPLIGALLLFVLQEGFGSYGVWYLAGVGGLAAGFALWLPQGLAGLWEKHRPKPSDSTSSLRSLLQSSDSHVPKSSETTS